MILNKIIEASPSPTITHVLLKESLIGISEQGADGRSDEGGVVFTGRSQVHGWRFQPHGAAECQQVAAESENEKR